MGFPKHICNFCGKPGDQVQCLIAGPNHQCICDECVTLCVEIVKGYPRQHDMIGRLKVWREARPSTPEASNG